MNTACMLGALKRRVGNILYHINTNTQVLGEEKVLQDVVQSILTLIADLSVNLPYRNDLNRVLIFIEGNKRHAPKRELLKQVKLSLESLSKDLEKC